MTNTDLADISYQLAVVFKSGLPVADGIKILSEDSDQKELSRALENISANLDEGLNISDSFVKEGSFPEYMCEMIKIGETAGKLPVVFDELHNYYLGRASFQSKLRSAISYPIVLLVMMLAVLALLIFNVLPVFHSLLVSLGGEVPAASMAIFNIADVLRNGLFIVIGVFAVIAIFAVLVFKFKMFPKTRSFMLLNLPIVGKVYKKNLLVKLTRAIKTLIASGYSFEMSAEKALPLIDDDVVEDRINSAVSKISAGEDAYDALRGIEIFPTLFFKMFKLGAKTGTLEEMSEKFTETYQRELDKLMDRTASMIEPVLVTIMSLVVGLVLLMTLLPLIGIISAIG